MKIWIDADACPRVVKELVFRASARLNMPVVLVANHPLYTPKSDLITSIVVEQGDDVADSWIIERVSPGEIVITADIPLAAFIVEKEAIGINPRGELYTEANVRERLSVRDFMQELRESGVQTGGPSAYGPKDKQRFANTLDRELTKMLKRSEQQV